MVDIKKWTIKEENLLLDMQNNKMSLIEMSKKLNRTANSVRIRISVMKVSSLPDKTNLLNNIPTDLLAIIESVSNEYEISQELMLLNRSFRKIVEPRQVCHFIAKKITKNSLTTIGLFIGRKDHATVLHGCRTISGLMDSNKEFSLLIDKLIKDSSIRISKYKIKPPELVDKFNNEFSEKRKMIKKNLSDIHVKILFNDLFKELENERRISQRNLQMETFGIKKY